MTTPFGSSTLMSIGEKNCKNLRVLLKQESCKIFLLRSIFETISAEKILSKIFSGYNIFWLLHPCTCDGAGT